MPFRVFSACSTANTEREATAEAYRQLKLNSADELSWLFVSHTEQYDSCAVVTALAELGVGESVHGSTSCLGVMTQAGFCSRGGRALGLFAISDPVGCYGVGAAEIGDDPRHSSGLALQRALDNAGRPGEMPTLIWMSAAPGCEEQLLDGIEAVVGPNIPVAGGSAADNTIKGNWQQIAGQTVSRDSVVISVLFTSVEISQAFHSGYDPTERTGVVTRADGRTLVQIDHRPAVDVYNEWTGGLLNGFIKTDSNILAATTFTPLGNKVALEGGIEFYRLIHPERTTADGALQLFASVAEGEEVILMTGSRESLISRAGRVVKAAIDVGEFDEADVQGVVMTYCAGCMLAVQDSMADVAREVAQSIQGKPYLGIFTFGEQGQFVVSRKNTHGNLMISCVVFSSKPAYRLDE